MAKYYDRCWNPIFGCKGAFTGCERCYAKALLKKRTGGGYNFSDVSINKTQYKKTFEKKPQLISVCTQSDLFQDDISDEIISGVLRKCNKYNYNNYLILTKYAENLKNYFNRGGRVQKLNNNHFNVFSIDNMMFGVTVCVNDDLYRINMLRDTEIIKHRFVAFEPVYEKIEINDGLLKNIEWVIVGGETGENAKPCRDEWLIEIVDAADKLNIPVFVNATASIEKPDKLKRNDIPFHI